MKAALYHDDLGKDQDVIEIPAEYADAAAEPRASSCSTRSPTSTRRSPSSFLDEAELPTAMLKAALRKAHADRPRSRRSSAARRSSTSASSGCSTRCSPTCPSPLEVADRRPPLPRRGTEAIVRSPTTRRAVRGLVFKITTDPRRRPLVRPRLLRDAGGRLEGPQRHDRAHGARRRLLTSTPTTARRSRRSTPATSSAPSASRRSSPATRSATPTHPILLENDRLPRDGHQHVDRARRRGRQGEAVRHPRPPGRRGPDLPAYRSTRRPARP